MRQHAQVWAWAFALAGLASLVGYGCARDHTTLSALGDLGAVVFVRRANTDAAGQPVVDGSSGQIIDYRRYVPGGGVFLLTPPRPDGALENLTAEFGAADFQGLDLSADARWVVFSMKTDEADHYHLYVASLARDASGHHAVRQLTFGEHDDVLPTVVPGGRVAFVTNQATKPMGARQDEYGHAALVTQLATIDVTAGDADRRLCPQSFSHTVDLFALSDGTLGLSRWEHLGEVDDVKLYRVRPDCTHLVALAGHHGKPFNSLVQAFEYAPRVFVGIAAPRHATFQAGALVRLDVRNQVASSTSLYDEEHVLFENLTPAVPTNGSPSPVGRFRTPRGLPDGRILTAWADGWLSVQNELEQSPPNFGLYVFDPKSGHNTLVYDSKGYSELWPIVVTPRAEEVPLWAAPSADLPTPQAAEPASMPDSLLGSVDVAATSLDERVSGAQFADTPLAEALLQTTHVRLIEGFSSEIGPVPMFGLTPHEGAAILGEVPVFEDGSFRALVPPSLPIRLQAIDKFGMAIRSEGTWLQTAPGESRTCGGCHESRTQAISPRRGGATTLAMDNEPASLRVPLHLRQEYAWNLVVQPILDAKCVSCHGPDSALARQTYRVITTARDGRRTLYDVPWLDLSATPMTVSDDPSYLSLSRSYVSLHYPQQLRTLGNKVWVEGALPPDWVVPGSARHSKLIEVLNPKAADGTLAFPARPEHDVAQGQPLTPAEKGVFVRSADLGGQYFSRQNVLGAACWRSEEAATGSCVQAHAPATAAVQP